MIGKKIKLFSHSISWISISSIVFILVLIFFSGQPLKAVTVRIDSPRGGYTTKKIQRVSGTITGRIDRAVVVVNGIPQDVPVRNTRFSVNVVVSPGENIVEVIAGSAKDRISFYAKVSIRDIKIVLTWDSARYVDLWVIDPKGEKCYWASPVTSSGGEPDCQ